VLVVGLTGGIGAGKSAVAARLAELGALVVDSDRLAREAVGPGSPGLAEVVAEFGAQFVTSTGELDRPALARRVFADEDARRRLERIVHPRVRAATAQIVAAAPADAIVVNDVPLLVEAGLAATFDLVVVVLSEVENRVARLARARGMAESEARARIAAQASDEQRRAVAHVVIINDGSLVELRERVDQAWCGRIVPAAAARDVRPATRGG
jgi:dephospho-CoA kinase